MKLWLLAAAVAEEKVAERQLCNLLGQYRVWAREREGVVLQCPRRVRLVRQPEMLAKPPVKHVLRRPKHGEGREGQDFNVREEAEQHSRGDMDRDVGERERCAERRSLERRRHGCGQAERGASVDRADEEAAAPRGGIGEQKGVRRRPPGDKVDVLQERDAVVKLEADECKGDRGEVRRREEHERSERLKGDGDERGGHEEGARVQKVELLERVGEGGGDAKRAVRARGREKHGLKDERLESRASAPRTPAARERS